MEASAVGQRWLPRILCAALALRLVAACGLQWMLDEQLHRRFLIEGDAEGYWDLAGDIAAGSDYAVYEPPRRILRMPGFPAVLAVPRVIFGDRLFPARLWLAFIGTLACWGVWRLALILADEPTALLATCMAAASPVLIAFTPIVLSETTFAAAMLLGLIPGAYLAQRHSTQPAPGELPARTGLWAALTGLGIALGVYVRPSWLLAGPLFALLLVAFSNRRWRALRDGLIVNIVLIAALLPWAWRNEHATGHFVLTTLWMGPSLYDGLNPTATGDSNMIFFDRDNLQARGLSEYDVNRHYRDEAWTFARQNPAQALRLAVVKLGRYWKPWPNAEQFSQPLVQWLVAASSGPVMLLAVVGLWGMRRSPWVIALTVGPIVYFAAIHAVFVSSLRYRLPAEYPLLVLAAMGLLQLAPGLRRRLSARRSAVSLPGEA